MAINSKLKVNMLKQNEIEQLLPWYVTGKLNESDRQKVAQYLASHPEINAQLDLIQQEQAETINNNEKISLPVGLTVNNFAANLETEFDRNYKSPQKNLLQSVVKDIRKAFQFPAIQFAGIAAALVIFVQAISLGIVFNQKSTGNTYTTASGPTSVAHMGTSFLIEFNPNATVKEISVFLDEIEGSIVKGPLAGGFYHVSFIIGSGSSKQITTLEAVLKTKKNIIKLVSRIE